MSEHNNQKKYRKPKLLLVAGCLSGLIPLILWVLHLTAWLGHAACLSYFRQEGHTLFSIVSLFNILALGSLFQGFDRIVKLRWIRQVREPGTKKFLIACGVFSEKTHRIWSTCFWTCVLAFILPLATFLMNKGNGHFFILAGIVFAAFSMVVSHHFALETAKTIYRNPFPGNLCVYRCLKLLLDTHPMEQDKTDGELKNRVELLTQISRVREEKKSDA